MLIEDLSMKLSIATEKMQKAQKLAKSYELKYNNINISELHKTIRNLESKLEYYKNKHIFSNKIEETFRICSVCQNQIDANDKRVKKLLVVGGRKQSKEIPASIFISSEEDEADKDKREINLLRQPKIMLDVKQNDKGFVGDLEDFDPRDS